MIDNLDDENEENTEPVSLDINLIKSKISEYSSKKLCEMIICDRYFGFHQEIAVISMEELSQRRINGDSFNFEEYIEDSIKTLPVLNFTGFDIRNVITKLGNK